MRRLRGALTPAEWRRAAGLAAAVAGLHVVGFVTLLVFVVPRHFALGSGGAFGVGLGITAYTLGARHAFDADHIAAIDNTTRKFMAEGRRPLSVGFFFSLGHSTIVFALALLLSVGVKALAGPVRNGGSTLHAVTGVIGTGVSGAFLYLIAILNLAVLVGIVRALRRGDHDGDGAIAGGPLSRLYSRFTRAVRHPWQMYPLGVLFGLGFDTATEVALLFLAAGAATGGLPFYAVLCLPVLFAAGMSLLDTLDGSFMNFAYGWAFAQPARKLFYNLVITGLSVAVALLIGSVELLSLATDKLHLTGGFWSAVGRIDLNALGLGVVALFAVTWAAALALWRFGRLEERWSR